MFVVRMRDPKTGKEVVKKSDQSVLPCCFTKNEDEGIVTLVGMLFMQLLGCKENKSLLKDFVKIPISLGFGPENENYELFQPENFLNYLTQLDSSKYNFQGCEKEVTKDFRTILLSQEYSEYSLADKAVLYFAKTDPELIKGLPKYKAGDQTFIDIYNASKGGKREIPTVKTIDVEDPLDIKTLVENSDEFSAEEKARIIELYESVENADA